MGIMGGGPRGGIGCLMGIIGPPGPCPGPCMGGIAPPKLKKLLAISCGGAGKAEIKNTIKD